MSLQGVRSGKGRLGILGGLIAIAAMAAAIGFLMPGAGYDKASAQVVRGCDFDRYGVLCLIKDAPDSRIPFAFDIERDLPRRIQVEEILCLDVVNDHEDETEFVEVLRGGEEVEIEFNCGIRVIERQSPGWDLIDVLCDYEDELYDVRREDDGIMILRDRTGDDSVGITAVRQNIECRFVNRPEGRPQLNLGGLFAGQPTPLPTVPVAVAPAATAPVITPPRTGDAGLR